MHTRGEQKKESPSLSLSLSRIVVAIYEWRRRRGGAAYMSAEGEDREHKREACGARHTRRRRGATGGESERAKRVNRVNM